MLAQMRSATFIKAMMIIVAVAFVGLMVFEWGADFSARGLSAFGDNVGAINGETISYKQFEAELRNEYQQARTQGAEVPEMSQIVAQTWERLVSQTLVGQQLKKFDIHVSDSEVNFYNRNAPPEWVQAQEFFHTDGQFDPFKYHQFLDNPGTYSNPQMKQFVLAAEDNARSQLLSRKLETRVSGSVKITPAEVRQAYIARNEKVRVAYIGMETTAIPDSLAMVTDAEIQTYYDKHRADFRQEAAIRAAFVGFEKTPTARDEAEAETEIRRVFNMAQQGEDFAELARTHSDDGSATRGGDLGFFGKNRMIKPFEDVAFSLEPGRVSEPLRTQFGWHIIKVEERKGAADSLEVRARHILIEIRPGLNTLDSLRVAARQFQENAEDIGFDAAVNRANLQSQDTGFITAGAFFPLLGERTSGMVNGMLNRSPGHVSGVYETDQGLFVFALRETRPEGPRPIAEVRNQIAARLQQRKKVRVAAGRLAEVSGQIKIGAAIEEAAKRFNLELKTPEPFARAGFVPGVGSRNAFVGAAFRLSAGQTSEVITTDRGAYILKVLEKQPIDEQAFEAQKDMLTHQLLSQKRQEVIAAWFTDLRENAVIVDNRHHFYPDL